MTVKLPTESYRGKVLEVTIGAGSNAVTIGGENVLSYTQTFDEGSFPHPPKFALEVWDTEPQGWAPWALEAYKDVAGDPAAWAQRCQELGADLIQLYLLSADPNEKNTSPEEAAELVQRVYDAIERPLIVYTTGNEQKDPSVLCKVAEVLSGKKLLLGPCLKENFEPIAKAAKEHGHCVISQAPVDINLQKELNVKLTRILPADHIELDPLSSALGYGIEYCFSVAERTKHVGVMFEDTTM